MLILMHTESTFWRSFGTRTTKKKALPSALIPLFALALLVFLASAPASAQLPPAIEADRLLVRAEREIQEGDYAAAAAALEEIVELQTEHGLEAPEAFWFQRAQVAQEAGYHERALESAARYIENAGAEAEHHGAALELLGAAEDAKELAEASETLSRYASNLEMVVIPAGSFRMGCVSGLNCGRDEKPAHEVNIQSFALSKHEVTFDDWDACVRGGGCNGYRPDDQGWGRGKRPVINVSWEDAQSFVAWLSRVTGGDYRLPTEAEWEYAARAGTQEKYSWGNEIGRNRANCGGCGSAWDYNWTAPVGSFAPNAFGLYDMHGNVQEWVEDCWNDSYLGAPVDGSAWLSGACDRFWRGGRVMRGGSYDNIPRNVRSANREREFPDVRWIEEGFRVARTLTP